MKVKDAIKQLQDMYKDQEEEIVIAWWDRDMFIDAEEFTNAIENEENVDWSYIYDQLLLRDN